MRYMLQRELSKKGKGKQLKKLKMIDLPSEPLLTKKVAPSPLNPKTTLARVVVSKRSIHYQKKFSHII